MHRWIPFIDVKLCIAVNARSKHPGMGINAAIRNRTIEHLLASTVYSQMLCQLCYSRRGSLKDYSFETDANQLALEQKAQRESMLPRRVFPLPIFHWPHGVAVSTLDSESSDRGTIPPEACSRLFHSPYFLVNNYGHTFFCSSK
jgi:hypothetical protein